LFSVVFNTTFAFLMATLVYRLGALLMWWGRDI
jgi:hypothetical protein